MSHLLITGGASGIGRHLALALSERGHVVNACDIDAKGLGAVAEQRDASRLVTTPLDVTDAEAWEHALDRGEDAFGPTDVVMNVAGVLRPAYVERLDVRDIDWHLGVNVKGVILGTRAAARRMAPRKAGHIVNFGSLASLAPVPGLSLYAASKFAVRGFTLAAATELSPLGVAVTLVMPDAVETPMLELQRDYEEAALTFSGGRVLATAEIVEAIVSVVLPKRPLELALPLGRGLLARLSNALPGVAGPLAPMLRKRGLANMRRKG